MLFKNICVLVLEWALHNLLKLYTISISYKNNFIRYIVWILLIIFILLIASILLLLNVFFNSFILTVYNIAILKGKCIYVQIDFNYLLLFYLKGIVSSLFKKFIDMSVFNLQYRVNPLKFSNIELHSTFFSGDDDPNKPYKGKGKAKATEEDMIRINREEQLQKKSQNEEDCEYKDKQIEYDYLLAKSLQEQEEQEYNKEHEEREEIQKIFNLKKEVYESKKLYNDTWGKVIDGEPTAEEKSKLEEEAAYLKESFNNKTAELNDSKDLFEQIFGYTPSNQILNSEEASSEEEFEEGSSRDNSEAKYDSEEERPSKKSKFSHDYSSSSKNNFIPLILFNPFSVKSFLFILRILLITIPIVLPEFNLLIYLPYFKDFYFIKYIIINLSEFLLYSIKLYKKIIRCIRISKLVIKIIHRYYIYILGFLFIILVVICF